MREEWQPVSGGEPTLHLWPESQSEATLTAVESELLHATLYDQISRDQTVSTHLATLSVKCRWFTGWGFYLDFTTPTSVPACPLFSGPGLGHATITVGDKSPLATACFAADGYLQYMEAFSIPGTENELPWPVAACVNLLRLPLSSVSIGTA